MHAALNLVSLNDVTHTAVRDGDWEDPRTWQDGEIPSDNAKVHIPNGITVTYGAVSEVRHDTVRVDGVLEFASDDSSKLILDTMVVSHAGELIIGSDTNPIQTNETADILFRSDTDIASDGDPTQLRRGLLSMGKVTVVGADKLDHIRLKQPALRGDSVLVLDLPEGQSQPHGWNIGDRLVLGGTSYRHSGSDDDNTRFRDEVLEITEIDGAQIRFRNLDTQEGDDTTLRFDHNLPDIPENDQLNLYVANTSRNVIFQSEDGQDTAIDRRGHIMLMHNPNVVVKNSEFLGLGRSDKGRVVDDPGMNVDGSPGQGTNPRGRYSLHLHRLANNTQTGQSAIISGNSVVHSPGWGIVSHSSKADLSDNVVFDVVGSGIVAEGGDEKGRWQNNIVIKTTGADQRQATQSANRRQQLFDHGFRGDGFWIQGAAQVELLDNIAISSHESGLTIFGDSLQASRDFRDVETIPVADLPSHLQGVASSGQAEVDITDVPINQFDGLDVYNSRIGLRLWGHLHNLDGEAEFNSPSPQTAHDLRSQISNFRLWGNRLRGLDTQYSTQIDFENGIIIGDVERPSQIGVFHNSAALNLQYDNLTVRGFEEGFSVPVNGLPSQEKNFLKSVLSNSTFSDNIRHFGVAVRDAFSDAIDDLPSNFKQYNNNFSDVASNLAPMAQFRHRNLGGLSIGFDASESYDPDSAFFSNNSELVESRGIVGYSWDFDGDGIYDATGRNVVHHYEQEGENRVTLTVLDNQGVTTSVQQTIQVDAADYRNPFVDSHFDDSQPLQRFALSTSRGGNTGWYGRNNARKDSNGYIVLSSTLSWGGSIGQVISNNKINRGLHKLQFNLVNLEGSSEEQPWLNNIVNINLWGINGQFDNSVALLSGPQQIGTLPFQAINLFSETITDTSSTTDSGALQWTLYDRDIELSQGYDFLVFQVGTEATRDVGDFVALDNVFLTGAASVVAESDEDSRVEVEDSVIIPPDSMEVLQSSLDLRGTSSADTLRGRNGDDTIKGLSGNDSLSGASGNDKILGASGDDTLEGNSGNDTLYGSAGNDLIRGSSGADKIGGGSGSDLLFGNDGDDIISGGNDSDELWGGGGHDRLFAGDGDDILVGGSGDDTLGGTNSQNVGRGEQDTLVGGIGGDRYVLGNKDTAYYLDSNLEGNNSYVSIRHFDESDRILLSGSSASYHLERLSRQTAIYFNEGERSDLIGIVEQSRSLNLSDKSQFVYLS